MIEFFKKRKIKSLSFKITKAAATIMKHPSSKPPIRYENGNVGIDIDRSGAVTKTYIMVDGYCFLTGKSTHYAHGDNIEYITDTDHSERYLNKKIDLFQDCLTLLNEEINALPPTKCEQVITAIENYNGLEKEWEKKSCDITAMNKTHNGKAIKLNRNYNLGE
jgi:hypothetical protein